MNIIFIILMGLTLISVLGSLFVGAFYMGKTGSENRKKSQKLMQARIAFQGTAVAFFVLAMIFSGS